MENWRYYTGPHLGGAIESIPPALRGLLTHFSPSADMNAMVSDAQSAGRNLRAGNTTQGLIDFGYAAAAPLGLALPGTIKDVRNASQAAYKKYKPQILTVPEHIRGLLWSPQRGGKKVIHGGEVTKTAPRTDPADFSATVVPTGAGSPRTILDPASLQGSTIVPALGDRTAARGLLTHINEQPLANEVLLEGGPGFMHDAAALADDVVWASGGKVVDKFARRARNLADEGKDINLVYTAGGGRNADFSFQMLDTVLQQLPGSKITKGNKRAFNAVLKKRFKDWPGLDSPDLKKFFLSSEGNANKRKAFLETMALAKWQEKGFPDFVSTRIAITEPSLLGLPSGVSGHSVARLDPAGRIVTDPKVPHGTYPVQLGGQGYVGGFPEPIPREVMFPDFFAGRRANPNAELRGDARAFEFGKDNMPITQPATQKWLDNVMQYLSNVRRGR